MNNTTSNWICQGSLVPKSKKSSTSVILRVRIKGLGMVELDFDVCGVGTTGNGVK